MFSILLDWWTGRTNEVTNMTTTIMDSQLIDYIMNSKIKHSCHDFNSMTIVPIKIELKQEEAIFDKKDKMKIIQKLAKAWQKIRKIELL